MTSNKFYELRDNGVTKTKCIFLHDDRTVVESCKYDGKYYIAEAQVDTHKEITLEVIVHEFNTAEEANEYFINEIKTDRGYIARECQRQANAKADYIASWGALD